MLPMAIQNYYLSVRRHQLSEGKNSREHAVLLLDRFGNTRLAGFQKVKQAIRFIVLTPDY